MSIDPAALAGFLVEAKRRTYAAQGDEAGVPALLPGLCQLEYRDGLLLYRDSYFGFTRFGGQEVVYHGGRALWTMVYSGGMTFAGGDAAAVYAFLRRALFLVEPERPYRGPASYREGACRYRDKSRGGIERFQGVETITCKGKRVYALCYSGGLVI